MSDYLLKDGDIAQFDPAFANRTLIQPAQGKLRASGHATVGGKRVCVLGDEASVVVQNVSYAIPGYSPGKGVLTIKSLQADQQARVTSSGGKKVLLRGSRFVAQLAPTQPAMSTGTPSTPEPNLAPTVGTGSFIHSQFFALSA